MKSQTQDQIDKLPKIIEGSDLVLGVGFVLGVQTVADILKIPYRFVIFYPSILGTSKEDKLIYRILFGFGRSMTNMVMKGFINKKRKAVRLKPIKDAWENWTSEHVIAACDKELNAVCEGVSFKFTQTGYMILPSQSELPKDVEQFISDGEPPIYIGFGSNPVSRPEKIGDIFNEVAISTGQRLIVSKGWANLSERNTSEIIYVDEMPFDLLFPRLAAIVYHGGTGTMAAAARAGIPQIAFPFMADQFENHKQIFRLGIGPKGCNFKKLTSDSISSAIKERLANDKYKKNAIEISRKIIKTDGLKLTIDLIENELKS